jgi:hypothetical protein
MNPLMHGYHAFSDGAGECNSLGHACVSIIAMFINNLGHACVSIIYTVISTHAALR